MNAMNPFLIMRLTIFASLMFVMAAIPLSAETIPFLSFQDLRAIYPQSKSVFDWGWPKIKKVENQQKLIEQCQVDFSEYFRLNLTKEFPSLTGKIRYWSLVKDPNSRIIYFTFEVEPDRINDFFVVYFFDPQTNRFILKTRL